MTNIRTFGRLALAGALALGLVATPALAQRDPADEAARKAGTVGEKPDGYLGVVGAGDAATRQIVDAINIKRRALYTERAMANGSTLEEYAVTAGCQAISRTEPGEKYMSPQGAWLTRGVAAPQRDPRCP
jgi:uncharacterized protein YdbL (DUF1318 family)